MMVLLKYLRYIFAIWDPEIPYPKGLNWRSIVMHRRMARKHINSKLASKSNHSSRTLTLARIRDEDVVLICSSKRSQRY